MKTSNWENFLSGRHRRLSRLWQSFFAGWGLFFAIVLAASPFIFKNISWTIIDSVDFEGIQTNNLSMTNLVIRGIDKNGAPFSVAAKSALQKFAEPGVIYFTNLKAATERITAGKKIKDDITARTGRFLKDKIVLAGDVFVRSSDGRTASANEMEIDLR